MESPKEWVWISAEGKWTRVVWNSVAWKVAEWNWKKIEEDQDSDEWKAAVRGWVEIQQKKFSEKMSFEKSFSLLVVEWFTWLYSNDHTDDEEALEAIRRTRVVRKDNYTIRNQIAYLQKRCGYDEDYEFLDFLKMLMPSGKMSSPIKLTNSEVIRYREKQYEKQYPKSRKEYEGIIRLLCRKTREIPSGVLLQISQFVSLLKKKLPEEMYSDTFLPIYGKPHGVSDPINWVSLIHHPV